MLPCIDLLFSQHVLAPKDEIIGYTEMIPKAFVRMNLPGHREYIYY